MARQTDHMLAKYVNEIEERQAFIDSLLESSKGEDLSDEKMELVTRAKDRIAECNRQMGPLEEARRISGDSSERIRQLALHMSDTPVPQEIEYRSAGAYVLDVWRSGLGVQEASNRLDLFNRAAAHQTTADNPGLLPTAILGPVVNFIDAARPLVNALGPRQLPNGSWSRPRVTQHTSVAKQTAEKTELVSQKMTIEKIPVAADTWGGYVNVSRQDIDWTQPAIMDLVINDLAAEYATQTENATADQLTTAATAGPTLPATPSGQDISTAVWGAAGAAYAATRGQGRLIIAVSPDMLGLVGPLFAPYNPLNAFGTGFEAGQFGQGVMGAVSGINVVMSSGLNTGTILVISTAAAEVYEDRLGSLQVVEPSVLGVQVAYAGYFACLTMEALGIIKVATTP